jgi:hypothetical protein
LKSEYALKAHGRVDAQTSALLGGEWSASRPGRFTPGEKVPGTHWIGGCVLPRTGLDDAEKILAPTETRTPTRRSTDYAIPTPIIIISNSI